MRITILTAGSRGDIQPYVALGLGLYSAGHHVRVATFDGFRELICNRGLEFFPVSNPTAAESESQDWINWQKSGANIGRYVRYFRRIVRMTAPSLGRMFDDYWHACAGADAVIGSSSAMIGPHLAEQLSVPYYWALLQPMSRTRAFPYFLSPVGLRLGRFYNLITYFVAEYVFWQLFKQPINSWRKKTFNLRPLAQSGPYGLLGRTPYPVFYGFSPSAIPTPSDWSDHDHVTGYWFLDRPADWHPRDELVRFLASGPPPVYIGLAGIRGHDHQMLIELSINALAQSGQRGILLTDRGDVSQRDWPDSVLKIESTPHDWLFRHVTAVVHHGGAGTTAAAFRAGVPAISVPTFFDQPFWSQRIVDLGVGPKPIFGKQLSVKRLSAAITTATSDDKMRARAAALGERIRAENGVECAVTQVNHYLATG